MALQFLNVTCGGENADQTNINCLKALFTNTKPNYLSNSNFFCSLPISSRMKKLINFIKLWVTPRHTSIK